jgi:hypothetical protein
VAGIPVAGSLYRFFIPLSALGLPVGSVEMTAIRQGTQSPFTPQVQAQQEKQT